MRKILLRSALVLTALTAAVVPGISPASAATGSWTLAQTHYQIVYDGGWARSYFNKPSSQIPSAAKITNTSVQVTPYINGRTTELVQLCYQRQYETTDYVCDTEQAITGTTTIPTTLFNGQSARGTVVVKHTLFGGTYPAPGGTAQDTVTVSYTY